MIVATALNDAGQAHVTAELIRLGLDAWDAQGTCADIEEMPDFCHVLDRGEVLYETPRGPIYIKASMVMTEDVA